MIKNSLLYLFLLLLLAQCSPDTPVHTPLMPVMHGVESIAGRPAYLASPYVTAGDRLYMVGHQDGQFPDLGWHVPGEMGGIWNHPIKLMDGFMATVRTEADTACLSAADTFLTYPFANQLMYHHVLPNLDIRRFQYVPDGEEAAMIEYTLLNHGDEELPLTFTFHGWTDLRPVWLGERTGMRDARDTAHWKASLNAWVARDSLNPWYAIFGSATSAAPSEQPGACNYQPAGQGRHAALTFTLTVPARDSLIVPITIAGSYHSEQEAQATYARVQEQAKQLLQAKKARYAQIARHTRLSLPDQQMEQAFRWVKYNTDWLIREVPEIGRGLSAGLPDYPWWFGVDNEYALQGAIMTGQRDIVYRTIELLYQLSEHVNGNGRIIHEASTNGAVFNPGNINETPQFATLIWKVFQWTGDRAFLQQYFPVVRQGLTWLMEQHDEDNNGLPDGFGMMEIHGLDSEMIDVAVYTQRAFADAAAMAEVLGQEQLAQTYRQQAERLRRIINDDFWVPAFNSYADFIGTPQQALRLLKDAIHRADSLNKPWAVKELQATLARVSKKPPQEKQGFVVHHNWVVNTPMETGVADTAKALQALETGSRFVNPFGVFVTGIDRDETAGEDVSSFAKVKKTFSYTGAVMTLPTGVQAIAENNYGRPDQALDYLQRMTRSFSYAMPGSLYEVSPDYGMLAQAWNIYSYAVPIVEQFFGILPMAHEQRVRIQPQMPSAWDTARVDHVLIGDNILNLHYERAGDQLTLTVTQTQHDWQITFAWPQQEGMAWALNGQPVSPTPEGTLQQVTTQGDSLRLTIQPAEAP